MLYTVNLSFPHVKESDVSLDIKPHHPMRDGEISAGQSRAFSEEVHSTRASVLVLNGIESARQPLKLSLCHTEARMRFT